MSVEDRINLILGVTNHAVIKETEVTLRSLIEDVRDEETERCAKVAEDGYFVHEDSPAAKFGKQVAAAIRRKP